jgi:hypothetical protein
MIPVIENDMPVICGECREMKRWEGPRKRRLQVCGCAQPEKKPRPINTAAKGRRLEVAERKKLEKLGVGRVRMQPGSGAFGTRVNETALQGDNTFEIAGHRLRQECKSRANDSGFKVIKDWMQSCDVLTIKQDRQAPLHVLSDAAWLHLVASANRGGE